MVLQSLDPRTSETELEVQRIIHLQNLANELLDAFTDHKRVTRSHIAYSKTIAKSDKKPSRHFIRSEAFVNEKVIYRKGPSNRAKRF